MTDRSAKRGIAARMAPALLLALLAPLLEEVLPGATRFSSIFVFPIEAAVWGGGAVMIRALVRRRGLGWPSLLLLGLALSVAEECLIQQTSLAPLVIHLKGAVWARAGGVNYVYLLWALFYSSVWVVLIPTLLVEMIFPDHRHESFLSRAGAIVTVCLFCIGAFLAWFTWTQIARTKVFHLPAYAPPAGAVIASVAAIGALIVLALRAPAEWPAAPRRSPSPPVVALGAALWAVLWYGLVLLAFGIRPQTPPLLAVAAALAVVATILIVLPRWARHPGWSGRHAYALIAGATFASMAVTFVGFIGAAQADLIFKIVADAIAAILLVLLGLRRR